MNPTLKNLIRLEELSRQYDQEDCPANLRRQITRLRDKLPADVLRHFDRLAEHGRAPVARVFPSGACGGCHLKLTPSDVLRFRHAPMPEDESAPMCPFCGCFLYMPDATAESSTTALAEAL